MPSTDAIVVYIDGGSRGNPGPAGFGVHIETADGALVEELHQALGVATNNVAEYRGLLAALAWALEHRPTSVHIRSDSELLVRQMRGEYRVKNPGLKPLHRQARELVDRLGRVTFEHVPRSRNEHADRLANLAMDEAEGSGAAPSPNPAPDTGRRGPTSARRPEPAEGRTPEAASRQSALPFDDDLPDNAPHSAGAPANTRRTLRR